MQTNKEWMSISDMMAGLMMVFLFIAIAFMQQINEEKKSLVQIAKTYATTQSELNIALNREFKDDLERWGINILSDNTIRFKNPKVLFVYGKYKVNDNFKKILKEFFPKYLKILDSDKYRNSIIELTIEGHTSSLWEKDEPYLGNVSLSQARAYNVLAYLYSLPEIKEHRKWLITVFRANGLAFSKTIRKADGTEDFNKSQRVEFKIVTDTEKKIKQILQESMINKATKL